jgi:voltage-gated potassium channel
MSIFIEGHESRSNEEKGISIWVFRTIFGTSTKAGKRFDVILLWAIVVSVMLVMLESVPSIHDRFLTELRYAEWFFTVLFTIEYALRIIVVRNPMRYILSFYGLVDLISILPSYMGLIITGSHSLMVVRTLRLLRVFRVLKLMRYVRELRSLGDAIVGSRRKIAVFLMSVLALTVIFGTVMYMIESKEAGFTSIPRSIYWAIVTLTTVGYGDIAPQTVAGQLLASIIMLLGYAIIAVPTGLVTAELINEKHENSSEICDRCGAQDHTDDARYCRRCGHRMVT